MKKTCLNTNFLREITITLLPIILYSCGISEPKSPRWDVDLNVPIAKKNYTLLDIIEKKSTVINHYTDGTNAGLLYYSDTKELDQITIKNELTIDGFSDVNSKEMGTISIDSDSVQTSVGFEWCGISASAGDQKIIPSVNNASLNKSFSSVEQFSSATVESGLMDLEITNNFPSPVSLIVSNIQISNAQTNELIAEYNNSVTIPALQKVRLKDLAIVSGVEVKNNLKLTCNISTSGSGGQTITLPSSSLTVKAVLKDVKVTQAVAKIPAQNPVVINGSAKIDEASSQPTKFQTVKLESGQLNLSVTNNFAVDAKATITIYNLKRENGTVFSTSEIVSRNSSKEIFSNYSLASFSFVSSDGSATNVVSYKISFEPLASDDYRTVKSTDKASGNISFSNLQAEEFTGLLKPTSVDLTRSSVSLDLKDLKNKLQFKELNLSNPVIELRLKPTAQMEFSINGRLEAKNSKGEKATMTLTSRTLYNKTKISTTDSILTLNADSLTNFFNKFSELPDSLIVYAGGIVNPDYNTISVKNSDVVTGKSKIEIPLEFGISGAEVWDSVEVDLSENDRDKIKDMNSLNVKLNITNGIPAELSFIGKLYDEYDNFLNYFPAKNSAADTVTISASSSQEISITVEDGEPEKISRAKYMRIYLKFDTKGENNSAVKFKTDDVINISASGLLNYNVSE
jgi:hypothetical protein